MGPLKHVIVLLYRIKLPLSIIPNLTIRCQTNNTIHLWKPVSRRRSSNYVNANKKQTKPQSNAWSVNQRVWPVAQQIGDVLWCRQLFVNAPTLQCLSERLSCATRRTAHRNTSGDNKAALKISANKLPLSSRVEHVTKFTGNALSEVYEGGMIGVNHIISNKWVALRLAFS